MIENARNTSHDLENACYLIFVIKYKTSGPCSLPFCQYGDNYTNQTGDQVINVLEIVNHSGAAMYISKTGTSLWNRY